jgi:hypothetical protein
MGGRTLTAMRRTASASPTRWRPAAEMLPRVTLFVCLAYTSWPATAVDVWIRGGLRTLVPLASKAGVDALPISVQLRLQVETLAP